MCLRARSSSDLLSSFLPAHTSDLMARGRTKLKSHYVFFRFFKILSVTQDVSDQMTHYPWPIFLLEGKGESVSHEAINDINPLSVALPLFTQAELGLLALNQFETQTSTAEFVILNLFLKTYLVSIMCLIMEYKINKTPS